MNELRRTALYSEHEQLGAHFTNFGGWDMPLRYASELAEHRAVREAAGLFDLSHMGEIWVDGPDAPRFLNSALSGNLAAMTVGKAKYTLMLNEHGGIIDDLICYRLPAAAAPDSAAPSSASSRVELSQQEAVSDRYLVVPNAGNASVVAAELQRRSHGYEVVITDATAATSLIAIQGPASSEILRTMTDKNEHGLIDNLPYYSAAVISIAGVEVLLARTGYTGEDGFEVYVPNEQAGVIWQHALAAGQPLNMLPAGLAARDSLRLEAGMPLYGNELGAEVNPFEANLGPVVSFKKTEDFVGRSAVERAKTEGVGRVLVGLRGLGRRAARSSYPVLVDGTQIGSITSGLPSPTLGYPIALAFVDAEHAQLGTAVQVDLRGKHEDFEVVSLPFYQRDA